MTEIEKKALEHACQCAGRSVHHFDRMSDDLPLRASIIAHARAIEQFEAFRQEVSDTVEMVFDECAEHIPIAFRPKLRSLIISKPDQLVEALNECGFVFTGEQTAVNLRAALAARGLEIREKQP